MTRTELVPTNKTKSTTNDMHLKRSDFLKFVRLLRDLAAILTFKKSLTMSI